MKARIQWAGEAMFLGESGSGHVVVMDGPPDHGGRNLGVRPMEMVLIGLGGCTNFDVVSILKKARQPAPVQLNKPQSPSRRGVNRPTQVRRSHLTGMPQPCGRAASNRESSPR